MKQPQIELYIDQLLIEGDHHINQDEIRQAITQELTTWLANKNLSAAELSSTNITSLQSEVAQKTMTTGKAIGQQVAKTLDSGLASNKK